MDETWKPIPGYSMYEVSNRGQVRSWHNNKWGRRNEPLILKPQLRKNGYLHVSLRKNGQTITALIHALVLTAFIGPCPIDLECCHGNGDPADNLLSNLRWDTRSANMKDAYKHGSRESIDLRGENHHQAKLTNAQVIEVRHLYAQGNISQAEIGEKFGMSRPGISAIINRRNWAHI